MKPPEPVVSAMDMHATTLPTVEAGRLNLVLDRITSGTDILVVTGHEEGRVLLDAVAQRLAGSRQRAIRVSVPAEGLSLSGLMAGITGRRDLAAHDDAVLELGFRTLTTADETCDGTVLLVSSADGLQRPALRYIQFACRAAKGLRVVLAGTVELADALANDELAALRTRLVALPTVMPREPVLAATATSAGRARRVPGWAVAGLGMAASLALGLWIGRNGPQPPALASVSPPSIATHVAAVPAQPIATPQPAPALDPASTQAVVSPMPAIPDEPAPRLAARAMEAPAQPARVLATPTPVADQASTPEAALPLPPQVTPPARPARATPPRRQDTRAIEAAAARRALGQSRASVVARPPSEPIRLEGGEDGPVRPPRSWQPEDTFGPMYSSLGRPRSFVGTYSANPDGTRTFRTEP